MIDQRFSPFHGHHVRDLRHGGRRRPTQDERQFGARCVVLSLPPLKISPTHPIFDLRTPLTSFLAIGTRMESCDIAVAPQDFAEARRVMSECWIYTNERGLRAMTLHGNGSSLAIDGQRLVRWCILDDQVPRSIVAYLYSADTPSAEMRERVTDLARERFGFRRTVPCQAD